MSDFRPAQLDIQIWKGDSWQQTFTLTLDSTPINLSTADVKIQIVSGSYGGGERGGRSGADRGNRSGGGIVTGKD